MEIEMVLNELSLQTPAPDPATARQWMSVFIQTLSTATRRGIKRILHTQDDINVIELAPNYPVAKWRNDRQVAREEQQFWRSLTTKVPLWTDTVENIQHDLDIDLSEFLYQNQSASGLGFAWVTDSLSVSLLSDKMWNCAYLSLDIRTIDDNESLIEKQVAIIHASRRVHIIEHEGWIDNHIEIDDGVDLWTCCDRIFPHLEFCESVAGAIQEIKKGNAILKQLRKRLDELERAAENWKEGPFNLEWIPSKATPESDSRLQEFRQKLTLECIDGKERLFSLHLRMTPGDWRLYFSTDLGPGKIIIGYMGRKIQ
ncbi:hypothetical protein [Roseofilum sp. Guam]|uniref:hypothetical protein n=1 Tax=Roseofilum sp. Guam TaxID=2821502 RepID=UPI001B1985EE|nr:hypothetical protein [Roseofilum sp. Guam]MBP0029701.1 hypothetical protein [Roseofilum sp. Guam]